MSGKAGFCSRRDKPFFFQDHCC
ncbi:hypothetical protein [uncultured Chryseobacterium sp.]